MAALTDLQFVALNAPALSTVPTKNGVTFPDLPAFFQTMLDSSGGNPFLALSMIFQMLYTSDLNGSLQLDQFAYTKRTNMTFDQAREYWDARYRESMFSQDAIAPKIQYGYWGPYGYGWGGY